MKVFVLILSFAIASQAYPKRITRSGREENGEWRKREKDRERGNGEKEEDRDELQRGFYEVDYALQVWVKSKIRIPHLYIIKKIVSSCLVCESKSSLSHRNVRWTPLGRLQVYASWWSWWRANRQRRQLLWLIRGRLLLYIICWISVSPTWFILVLLLHLSPPHQVDLGHALFFAALLGRVQIVQTLLEKGAKVVILRTQSKFAHISHSPFPEKVVMAFSTVLMKWKSYFPTGWVSPSQGCVEGSNLRWM